MTCSCKCRGGECDPEWHCDGPKLRALLSDQEYIRMKADYNRGRLSWANMIEERERGLGLSDEAPR
jgi:hypothetical protein